MDGPGSVLAFGPKGGVEAGRRLFNGVSFITLAVSPGGVETLVEPPASVTHQGVGVDEQRKQGITDGLVRLALGCEDADDLWTDPRQALDAL